MRSFFVLVYKPYLISTVVDSRAASSKLYVYKPNLISTVVDLATIGIAIRL